MGKFAWVTLATNDSYSLGALVLAHSLRRVNTAHQLVVLITPGVTEAMKTQLSAVFNVVKLVDVLDSRDAENLTLLARPELGITFTKLHCWKLTEYEKCVFLDADTLVLQNSDELFEREELSAAPDAGWPDCFNSGVFVYKPSQETFQALIEFALIHGSFDGGDQGLLNLFFSDWATKDIKKHLPFVYNMCSTATYSYLPAFKQYGAGLKIIHFIGAAKPWFQPFNTETGLVSVSGESQHLVQFVQLWWDTFCAHVHPTLSTEMAGLAGALATVTLGAPLSVEQRALEEHLRRQGWEQGNIDYMGKDSFANIWQKICETLGTSAPAAQPSPPEDAPAPVAPVAAPVYVSSVEISPSGQIDKTPPQANYAPVSALKPTVEASDIKDATAAPISETATVAPEPKPSVTEIAPTEASITPSATLETAKLKPQDASEPPATQQSVAPAESTEKTETAPATLSETPVTPTVVTPTPSVQTPVEAPVLPQSVPTQIESAPTPTPIESVLPLTSIEVPVLPSSAPTATDVSALTPTTAEAPASTPSAPAPTEVPVSTPIEAPALPPAAATPTESALTPAPTESQVSTPPAPAPIEVPISTPTELPASTPPAQIATETPVPSTPIPTETPVPPAPVPIDAPVPAPTETPISSTPAPVTTPVPTEAPISSPPASTPTGTPTPATPALLESPVPGSPASTPAPTPTTQVAPETTPAPPESTASVAVTEPSAPVPAATPGNLPTPTAESIAPIAKAEPATPQTPTVTEPTPPTSPPVVADTPQLTKLQVEADVPGTPPAGGSTQPSLGEAVADEPPVPPKRKGGSKAPQDSKNQKGGKPSKGKK